MRMQSTAFGLEAAIHTKSPDRSSGTSKNGIATKTALADRMFARFVVGLSMEM